MTKEDFSSLIKKLWEQSFYRHTCRVDSEYSVMLYVFQLAAYQATGSLTEKQQLALKWPKGLKWKRYQIKEETNPPYDDIAKRNMTLMNQIKVYGLDATIIVGGGTTFLMLA